jgi:hypothetical protein
MKSEIPQDSKSLDNDLAKLQTSLMDALAPLTALVESADDLEFNDVRQASLTAIQLIGNTNSHLSQMRREKIVGAMNKALLPLVKDNSDFTGSSPDLFGTDFAKRSKDFLGQI